MSDHVLAVEVSPHSDGLCPLLKAGEWCRDGGGEFHFCTPEGSRFSTDAEVTKNGGTITEPYHFAGTRYGTIENRWTMVDGWWIKVQQPFPPRRNK